MGQFIRLNSPDGHEFPAYLAKPNIKARGGLGVGMEMYGVNNYLRAVCDDFAAAGYLVIAPALFERLDPELTLPYDEIGSKRGKELSGIIDHDDSMLDISAAADYVRDAGKVAILGFCFGGTVTWLAASRCQLDGAIAYYGSNMCDYPDEIPRCPVICHVGDLDTAVPTEDVEVFQVAHPEVHWFVYQGAQHGFDNITRPSRYHPQATTLARERSLSFLSEYIG